MSDEKLRDLWASGESKPLVFIMGLHRSGTTILYEFLSRVLPVAPVTLQDVVFFARMVDSRLKDEGRSDRQWLVEYFEANGLAKRGLDDIALTPETVEEYGWILKREAGSLALNARTLPTFRDLTRKLSWMHGDASALLLKNPWDTAGAPWIASALPEARFVFLLRDPIEIANSELRNAQRMYAGEKSPLVQLLTTGIPQMRFYLGLARFGHRVLGNRRSERVLISWILKDVVNNLREFRSGVSRLPASRVVEIRYGDLVDDTEQTLRRVADFLQLPISDTVRELRGRRRSGGLHPALEARRAEFEERIEREGLGWALGA